MTPVEIIRGVFNPACAFTGKETEESDNTYPSVNLPADYEGLSLKGLACLFEEIPRNRSRDNIRAWLKILLEVVRSSWAFPCNVTLKKSHGADELMEHGKVRIFNYFWMRLRRRILKDLFGLEPIDDVVEVLRAPSNGMIPAFSAFDKDNLRVTLREAVNRETARVAAEAARADDARVAAEAARVAAEAASMAAASTLAEMARVADPLPEGVSLRVDAPPVPPGSPPVPTPVRRCKKKACVSALIVSALQAPDTGAPDLGVPGLLEIVLGGNRRVKKRACRRALPIEVEPVAESGEAPAAPVAACDDLIERAFRTTLNEYTYFELPRSIIEAMLKRPAMMSPISHAYRAAIPIPGRTVDKDKAWDFARVLREAIQAVCEECKLTNDKPNILRDIVKITINAILQHGGINETLGYKGVYWWQTILKSP